jgi:hypothetical protein
MPLDTIPTSAELVEKYREYAHKCIFNAMLNNKTVESAQDYVENVAQIVDNVIDGVLRMATEVEMDEMRDKVQKLLNI